MSMGDRKEMRVQLKRQDTQHVVQVDSSDPAAVEFTSGPYGHGSRVFAKVCCYTFATFFAPYMTILKCIFKLF